MTYIVREFITWITIMVFLHFHLDRGFTSAIGITSKHSFQQCFRGDAILFLNKVSLDRCLFECKIRCECDVIQYRKLRRQCEILTSADAEQAVLLYEARSCLYIKRQDISIYSELADLCANCTGSTVCDIETGACTIKECRKLAVENGTVNGNMLSVGSKIAVECDKGFHLDPGYRFCTCRGNGTWSHVPTCVRDTATSPCNVTVALVTGPHGIDDAQLTSSSVWSNGHAAEDGRLDGARSWVAGTNDVEQYWQADFDGLRWVTGITTQGSANDWVESYTVQFSYFCLWYYPVRDALGNPEVFAGNSDGHSHVNNTFHSAVLTRCIRVNPRTWKSWPTMRIELLGCY